MVGAMNTGRLVAWMLPAMLIVAGCVGQIVPTNGVVVVHNLGHGAAAASWPTPGFFGTPLGAGTDTRSLGPCSADEWSFWAGDYPITITSATDKLTFVLQAAPAGQLGVRVTYVIDAGGHIAPVDPATVPANGTCPP